MSYFDDGQWPRFHGKAIAACWATASKPVRPKLPRPLSLWIVRRMVGHLAELVSNDIDGQHYDQALCDLMIIVHNNGHVSLEHGSLDTLARKCRENDRERDAR